MIICNCHNVSNRAIAEAIISLDPRANLESIFKGLQEQLQVSTDCGSCENDIKELIKSLTGGNSVL